MQLSEVSVVLPSLDPDEKLDAVIDGLLEYGFTDIILVNDGSKPENLPRFQRAADTHKEDQSRQGRSPENRLCLVPGKPARWQGRCHRGRRQSASPRGYPPLHPADAGNRQGDFRLPGFQSAGCAQAQPLRQPYHLGGDEALLRHDHFRYPDRPAGHSPQRGGAIPHRLRGPVRVRDQHAPGYENHEHPL